MISLKEVEDIHATLIEYFGGSHGIRDLNSLESALNRPYQTFNGQDLYPTYIEKASALLESILINHPFVRRDTEYSFKSLFETGHCIIHGI